MNMNTTRLDDKINSLMVGVALALALGFGIDMAGGAALGDDGQMATRLARASVTAPADAAASPVVQVAQAATTAVR